MLRATTACFFDISTSKSGPVLACFVHFDLDMCFVPQRGALFGHLNFQKWSENGVFCTFSLRNLLRATTARTFSTSQLPKVARTWCVLYILTWKCASRHNGVHFLDISTSKSGPRTVCFVHFHSKRVSRHNGTHFFDISTAKSGLHLVCFVHFDLETRFAFFIRARRFSELTFRASGAPNHWKNTVFPDFPTFSSTCIFLLLTLLSSNLSLLPASSLLCFSSVHIVGSLTSKLPSTMYYIYICIYIIYGQTLCKLNIGQHCDALDRLDLYQGVVCMMQPRRYAFTPCGHRCVCHICAVGVTHMERRCPICRAKAPRDIPGFWGL